MCGIIGAVAQRNIVPILIDGLKRLEYRGYDSCGVAVHCDGLQRARSIARVSDLENQIKISGLSGFTGISHTRWATHGAPIAENAHPHFSTDFKGIARIAVVHNGVIENYEKIRLDLIAVGYIFVSQTDTEAIAHLINYFYDGDLLHSIQLALGKLSGTFAIAVFCRDEPNRVIGARSQCPLVVGVGNGENFLASDVMALAGVTNKIIFLEDGDVVDLRPFSIIVFDKHFVRVERPVSTISGSSSAVDLGAYNHYMQKEIFEQPQAIADTLNGITAFNALIFGEDAPKIFSKIDAIQILACGTSYYAGFTAKYWLEAIAGIPTTVETASEYRYRIPAVNPNALVIVISQSGETADTLAALKYARELGHRFSLSICNVESSAMVRETSLAFLTKAGPEIGVASTKACSTQLTALFLFTLIMAKIRGRLSFSDEQQHLRNLLLLPSAVQRVLTLEPMIICWSRIFAKIENVLFLGRGLHYPIALEGALKLKEITYIHAEAYPAGELKHGPLALVTDKMPVVTIAPNNSLIEKLKSNMQEVRARGGELYIFSDADSNISQEDGFHIIRLPENYGLLSPILHLVPLQLLAYHAAVARGTDVDKPRNLAKSVTVE